MALLSNFGLIANYQNLLTHFEDVPALKNLVTAIYNDKNTFSLFLTCPISNSQYQAKGESEFESKYGINKVLTFGLANLATWIYPDFSNGTDSIDVHCVEDSSPLGRSNLVKSSSIELRFYKGIGEPALTSKVSSSFLKELGITTVVITKSELMFGVKQ